MPRREPQYRPHPNFDFVEGQWESTQNEAHSKDVPNLQAAPTATERLIKANPFLSQSRKDVQLHIHGTEPDPGRFNINQIAQMNGHLSKDFELQNYLSEQREREKEFQEKRKKASQIKRSFERKKASQIKRSFERKKASQIKRSIEEEDFQEKRKKASKVDDDHRSQKYWANQIRLGACKNCGEMGHDVKSCFERPSKFSKGTKRWGSS